MIDLHMHSCYSSDGERTPAELAAQCAAQGVSLMAVADHNCARANTEAAAAARKEGISCLSGIEIDCVYERTNFHVLGYGIAAASPDFLQIEQDVRAQSLLASHERLRKTQALGFRITESELQEKVRGSYWDTCWTGELFAEILLAKTEYARHPLLAPYRAGGGRANNPLVNFYWDFYAQGRPCYVPEEYPPLQRVTEIIHSNQGAAVLAHPGVNLKGRDFLLSGLLSRGIDGIEAYSSYHTPEQAEYYAQAAREYGLFVTCGSDYHGKTKPAIRLGMHGCPLSDAELLAQLPDCMRQFFR